MNGIIFMVIAYCTLEPIVDRLWMKRRHGR